MSILISTMIILCDGTMPNGRCCFEEFSTERKDTDIVLDLVELKWESVAINPADGDWPVPHNQRKHYCPRCIARRMEDV